MLELNALFIWKSLQSWCVSALLALQPQDSVYHHDKSPMLPFVDICQMHAPGAVTNPFMPVHLLCERRTAETSGGPTHVQGLRTTCRQFQS